jgi:hypothetical protein
MLVCLGCIHIRTEVTRKDSLGPYLEGFSSSIRHRNCIQEKYL